jgi:competence protein ComEC
MTLICLSIAWLVGIALGSWLEPPTALAAALVLLFLLLLCLWRNHLLLRRALGLLLVAMLGALRVALAQPSWGPGDVAFYVDQPVQLWGMVAGEAEEQPDGVTFPLQVEALAVQGDEGRPVRGTVLVQGERFLELAYGDRVLVTGTLALPRSTGGFSYRDYLARQGIFVLLKNADLVQRLPGPGGFLPARGLYALRGWARARLEALLPEPSASLLVGVLLGSRASIPPEVQQAFSRSGTSHILAISGWNINIVAAFLAAAGRRLSRRASLLLVLAGIVLYTLLVGAGAAVLRAALMGILYVVAQQAGRPSHGLTALFASAWAMTMWNPLLLGDLGFELSFAATLGMLLFVPVWTEALSRWPGFLSESLAATISSQLVTWPLMALYFRQFSLVVPLSNFLACPALAPLMLLGALTLFLGGLPGLGVVLRGLTWLVGSYMLGVVRWTGSLPWAAVPMPALGAGFVVLYYGVVGGWLWKYQRSTEN